MTPKTCNIWTRMRVWLKSLMAHRIETTTSYRLILIMDWKRLSSKVDSILCQDYTAESNCERLWRKLYLYQGADLTRSSGRVWLKSAEKVLLERVGQYTHHGSTIPSCLLIVSLSRFHLYLFHHPSSIGTTLIFLCIPHRAYHQEVFSPLVYDRWPYYPLTKVSILLVFLAVSVIPDRIIVLTIRCRKWRIVLCHSVTVCDIKMKSFRTWCKRRRKMFWKGK